MFCNVRSIQQEIERKEEKNRHLVSSVTWHSFVLNMRLSFMLEVRYIGPMFERNFQESSQRLQLFWLYHIEV